MPRIGKFLPFMLALISVVAIFMFGLIPSSYASSDFDNFKAKTDVRYSVKIDENNRTVTVEATFENLDKDSFEMSFLHAGAVYEQGREKYVILDSDGSIIDRDNYGWRMNIGGDHRAFVKYRIENLASPFTSEFFYQDGSLIFAIPPHPEEKEFNRERRALVQFNVPENWAALGIWKKLDDNTFLAKNLYELRHAPVASVDTRWEERGRYYGIETVFYVEKAPKAERKDGLDVGFAFSHNYDLNIRKDAAQISKRATYAMNYFSEKWDVKPPRRLYISSWYNYDFPWRESLEHHIGQFFVPSVGYFTQYLDSEVAAKYTGENRYLGKIYAMYLTYERGLKERLKEGVEGVNKDIHHLPASTVYKRIRIYGYAPVVLQYLNGKIKEKTGGYKSLHDVLNQMLENRPYCYSMPGLSPALRDPVFIDKMKQVTGIDFSSFYKKHVLGDYEVPVEKYEREYRDDFKLQLDYFRRNNEAPPILYYAYIEIAANVGVPEYYFYQPPMLVGEPEGSHIPTVRFFRKFLSELSQEEQVSRSEFIETLNSFTENSSNDFFEFYSKYGPRKPSIKALNCWLEGNYDSIVRRKIYAEKSLEKLSNMDSEVNQFQSELKNIGSLLEYAENLLNSHQLEESLMRYKKAIEEIHRIRKLDDDGDGLPNICEAGYGLNPNNEDSDKNGLADNREVRTIKLDGFAQKWQNLNGKSTEETEGIIERIETVKTENYLNIRVEYSNPLYLQKNSQINFDFDFNQDWSDDDRYSFGLGSLNVPIEGSLDSSLENYVYVGDQNLEFKIPIETLEILRFPEKASLRVYIRSDLEGPEFGDGWDTDLGWGQIDNVKILGEFQEKADFEVSNLDLSKEKVKQGETTTASVKVTNTGGKKGTYTAKLSIDGEFKTQSVTLKPDESEKVTFKISSEKAGTYQVKIGELSKTLNVRTPEKAGKGLPWTLIGGIIVVVIAISAFALYKRK